MLQLISTIEIYKQENPSMQSVKDHQNVKNILFVVMVTVNAQHMISAGMVNSVS